MYTNIIRILKKENKDYDVKGFYPDLTNLKEVEEVFNKIKEGLAQSVNNNGELVLLDKENKEFVLTIGDIL